jgi:hypothetical protein
VGKTSEDDSDTDTQALSPAEVEKLKALPVCTEMILPRSSNYAAITNAIQLNPENAKAFQPLLQQYGVATIDELSPEMLRGYALMPRSKLWRACLQLARKISWRQRDCSGEGQTICPGMESVFGSQVAIC